jgi:hypothetical protein
MLKGKVAPVLNYALFHEGVWGRDIQIHIFLTSVLVGGEWLASGPCRFTPGERASSTHSIGGCVDPRAGLDDMKK